MCWKQVWFRKDNVLSAQIQSIAPVIQSFINQGAIVECPNSPCNTPILPVKKPNGSWRPVPRPQGNKWGCATPSPHCPKCRNTALQGVSRLGFLSVIWQMHILSFLFTLTHSFGLLSLSMVNVIFEPECNRVLPQGQLCFLWLWQKTCRIVSQSMAAHLCSMVMISWCVPPHKKFVKLTQCHCSAFWLKMVTKFEKAAANVIMLSWPYYYSGGL